MLEIVNKLSLTFGHIARAITVGLFLSLTTAIAILSFSLLIISPFEYSYSQDDLALADLVALVLLGLASWRYFSRGRQSGTSLWPLIKRFVFTVAYTTLVLLSVLALAASIARVEPELATEAAAGGVDDMLLYGVFCVFIATIFGATPLPPLFQSADRASQSSPIRRETTWNKGFEEAEPPTLEPTPDSDSKEPR